MWKTHKCDETFARIQYLLALQAQPYLFQCLKIFRR